MANTNIRGEQIADGSIRRVDLNTTIAGKAVIAKLVQGTGISLSSTGADSGTGDVTVNLAVASASQIGGVKIGAGISVDGNGVISVSSLTPAILTAAGQAVSGDDFVRIIPVDGGSDLGGLEIATSDGGNEPIYIRQYLYGASGPFTTIVRTATLLDALGNTILPGTITANGGTLTGSLFTRVTRLRNDLGDQIDFKGSYFDAVGSGSKADTIQWIYGANRYHIATNGTVRMTIDGSGNIGINKAPNYALDVNGNTNLTSAYFNSAYVSGGNNWSEVSFGTSSTPAFGKTGSVGYFENTSNSAKSGVFLCNYSNSEQTQSLFVKTGGNVGIGTEDPFYKTHITMPTTAGAVHNLLRIGINDTTDGARARVAMYVSSETHGDTVGGKAFIDAVRNLGAVDLALSVSNGAVPVEKFRLYGANGSAVFAGNVTATAFLGNATTSTKASTLAQAGGSGYAMTFNWAGNVGGNQPTWLWGGFDGVNHYVYNPSNFSVNYASSSGYSNTADRVLDNTIGEYLDGGSFLGINGQIETNTADLGYGSKAGLYRLDWANGPTNEMILGWNSSDVMHFTNAKDNNYDSYHSFNQLAFRSDSNDNIPRLAVRKGDDVYGTAGWQEIITAANINEYVSTLGGIYYNTRANSTYQMLWGSGNAVYATDLIYCNPYTGTISATAGYFAGNESHFSNGVYADPDSGVGRSVKISGLGLAVAGGTKTDTLLTGIIPRIGPNVAANPENGFASLLYAAIAAGRPVYNDEEFAQGFNSVSFYNNVGNGSVSITRESDSQAPNKTRLRLRINYNGAGASPNLGGFILPIIARANITFVQRFRAKLPVGYAVTNNENSMGSNAETYWLSSQAGTGKWEEYIRVTKCGNTGSFSSGGHVSVTGPAGAFVWYLASANVYEIQSPTIGLPLESAGASVSIDSTDIAVTAQATGFYRGSNLSNTTATIPGDGWWYIATQSHGDTKGTSNAWVYQEAVSYGTGAGSSTPGGQKKYRTLEGSVSGWTPWRTVIDSVNIVDYIGDPNAIHKTGDEGPITGRKWFNVSSSANESIFVNNAYTGNGFYVMNQGGGKGVYLYNYNGTGMLIDNYSSNSAYGLWVNAYYGYGVFSQVSQGATGININGVGTGGVVQTTGISSSSSMVDGYWIAGYFMNNTGVAASRALYILNSTTVAGGIGVELDNSGAGANNQIGMLITHGGTNSAIKINCNSTASKAVLLNQSSVEKFSITNTGLVTSATGFVHSGSGTSTGSTAVIKANGQKSSGNSSLVMMADGSESSLSGAVISASSNTFTSSYIKFSNGTWMAWGHSNAVIGTGGTISLPITFNTISSINIYVAGFNGGNGFVVRTLGQPTAGSSIGYGWDTFAGPGSGGACVLNWMVFGY